MNTMEADTAMRKADRPDGRLREGSVLSNAERCAQLRDRYALTVQEARVATQVAEGHTVKEIAATLGVTVFTVRAHLRSIFLKTDVNRQAALVRVVLNGE
jgi:DNA-binding CsgD family transcriptional regulator